MSDLESFFIDYETFWGVKYSLRSNGMSYTDYVLHDKFQCHGASVAFNDDLPTWQSLKELHTGFGNLRAQIKRGRNIQFVGHNVLFDGIITTLVFDTVFPKYFCTLAMIDALFQGAMGRGLDEAMKTLLGRTGKTDIMKEVKDVRTEDISPAQWLKLRAYANEDLSSTIAIYKGWSGFLPPLEHEIMSVILRMFCNPTLVFNDSVLREAVQEADDDRRSRIENALSYGTDVDTLRGNVTFPAFLETQGYEVPMKPSPSVKGKMIPALAKTDEAFQAMLESKDEKLKALAEGRLAVKSTQATTRAYRFLKLHTEVEVFPVAYNYARAHTWRVSGANKLNAANLKRGSKLRLCIEAPIIYKLGVADASQIECRSNGYIAGQESLMTLFRSGEDPYNDMATSIFNREIDRKGNPDDYMEGFIGKTATLGLGFQMGGKKYASTVISKAKLELGIDLEYSDEEGARVVSLYRTKNWAIVNFWETCKGFLFDMVFNRKRTYVYPDGELIIDGPNNKIIFPNGTYLYYPMLEWHRGDFTYMVKQGARYITKYIYGGLLCENIVQHFARNITSHHMVQISERYQVVMHTYDENVALIPKAEAEEGTQWMIDLMKVPPGWCKTLPLDAEGGFAQNYSK